MTTYDDTRAWIEAALGGRPMPAMAVIIGLDDPAVLDALAARRGDVRVLAVDPDPRAAARFAATGAASAWRAEGRLCLLAGPAYTGSDDAWRFCPSDPDDHVVLASPRAAADRPSALEAARLVGRIVFGARANAEARRQFAPRYLRNSLANLPVIARGSSVAALDGVFSGQPAVVVGAGPSLDAVSPVLAGLASRAVTIATDTTLRALRHAGVSPQIVVGADPSARNARHFFALPPSPDTWLVAESALDPDAVEAFADRTFWFRVSDHDPWPWFRDLGVDTAPLDMWGSVLTAAFQVAMLAGCDPIVFIGADLSFTGGRPYARGTTYEFDWAYSAALGVDLAEAWRQQIATSATVRTPGVDGRDVPTSPALQAFRDWLLTRAASAGRRVLNATGGGILVGPGIEQVGLERALRGRPALVRPARPHHPTTRVPPASLSAALRDVAARVRSGTTTPLLTRWTAFSAGTLDHDGVDQALRRAGHGLAADVAPRPRAWLPWAALSDAGWTMSDLATLPEHVGRASAGTVDPTGLAVAARLLPVLLEADATSVVPQPLPAGTAPETVPERRLWSPALDWPLRVFESCVGALGPGSETQAWTDADAVRAIGVRSVGRWLQASTAGLDAEDAGRVRAAGQWLAASGPAAAATAAPAIAVQIDVDTPDGGRLTRACHAAPADLSTVVTGAAVRTRPDREGPRVTGGSGGVTVRVRFDGVTDIVRPLRLTGAGLPPSTGADEIDGGVVVAHLHGTASTWIGADGALRPHQRWPLAIVGERRVADGTAAWHNGTAAMPALSEGYLLLRDGAGATRRHALPWRPTAGVWAHGRLWFTTFRSGAASWSPDAGAQTLPLDASFRGVVADADGVTFAPMSRDADGRALRQRQSRAPHVARDGSVSWRPLTALGACAAAAAHLCWEARAYPDADLVQLVAGGHTVDFLFPIPVGLGWAGDSLVVCTGAGDVWLLPQLASALDAQR